MNEYMYGCTRIKPTRVQARKMDRIAREESAHGCGGFTECNVRENAQRGINNGRYWAWFVSRNRGEPFNSELRARVVQRVRSEVGFELEYNANQAGSTRGDCHG